MPLTFDTTGPVDSNERRIRLVRAIVEAQDRNGERHWIEWKRELDFASEKAEITLAQEILAMANRARSRAVTHCSGWGYIVVGVDHTGVYGVRSLSTSALEQTLSKFLGEGADAPRWEPVTISVDDKAVLIIGVEPPLDGDPIYALRAKNGKAEAGTIFARTTEKAQRANADQLRMLQQRLLAGSFEDRITERLAVACATLDAELECGIKSLDWRWTARICPRNHGGEYAPEVYVVGVANGSLERTLPADLFLAPLPGNALVFVYPRGSNLQEAAQEVEMRLRGFWSVVDENPLADGYPVVICDEGFSKVHSAVQWMLRAVDQSGSLPMSFGLNVRKVSGSRS